MHNYERPVYYNSLPMYVTLANHIWYGAHELLLMH